MLSRFEALRSETTPLVGRGEELDLLLRRWEQVKTGEGRVVLLAGEPGIGKSRLTAATGTPICPRCSGSPTPDSCRMCGEPIAPADRITSRAASARSTAPPRENSTPTARLPSNRTRATS